MSSPTADHAYHPLTSRGAADRQLQELWRWKAHSRLIKRLRWALPAAMAGLLAILLGWAAFDTLIEPLGLAGPSADTSIRMMNPRFYGRDQGGKAFSVAAVSAMRDNNQFQRIYVEKPMLILGAAPGPETKVSADKGVYHEDTRMLILDGDVHVHDSQGNDFLTSHAVINTVTDDVDGPAPVAGHGPLGRIASSSYAVHDGGAQILFNGRVVARIEQGGAPQSPAVALKGPR